MELGYINGKFVSLDEKVIPIDERGHQFGDGIYEYIRFYNGVPFMLTEHLERLINSAEAIRLPLSESMEDLKELIFSVVGKSQLSDCNVYLQITRGIAVRNHIFPDVPVSISMTVREAHPLSKELREKGVKAITHADERWANCYIKSLNLLPNVLAKQAAHEADAFEAILVRDGYVTEGSSSNVFIVKEGKVYTTPLSKHILSGITRMAVKALAVDLDIPFVEKHITVEELLQADEVFITSTSAEILPVVQVNDTKIGAGSPGPATSRLYAQFNEVLSAL